MPTMLKTSHSDTQAAVREMMRALSFIQSEQTYSGEIASYQQVATQIFEYRLSPYLSTYVYDALSYFEPNAMWWQADTLVLVPQHHQSHFVDSIRQIRRKIRAFLAWQEEVNDTWRFYGRGSGIAPDADTTSCASMVMLERPHLSGKTIGLAHTNSLRGMTTPEGFYTSVSQSPVCEPPSPLHFARGDNQPANVVVQNGVGSSQLVENSVDWPAQANCLRYLTFVGEDQSWLCSRLLDATASSSMTSSIEYPTKLFGLYIIARAWRQCTLPDLEQLRSLIVPQVLLQQQAGGNFGNTLDTALGLCTLQELDYWGPECEAAVEWLIMRMRTQIRWEYDLCCRETISSPASAAALSLLALARHFGRLSPRTLHTVDWVTDYQ